MCVCVFNPCGHTVNYFDYIIIIIYYYKKQFIFIFKPKLNHLFFLF